MLPRAQGKLNIQILDCCTDASHGIFPLQHCTPQMLRHSHLFLGALLPNSCPWTCCADAGRVGTARLSHIAWSSRASKWLSDNTLQCNSQVRRDAKRQTLPMSGPSLTKLINKSEPRERRTKEKGVLERGVSLHHVLFYISVLHGFFWLSVGPGSLFSIFDL